MPVDRMPFGLIQHQIQFFCASDIRQVNIVSIIFCLLGIHVSCYGVLHCWLFLIISTSTLWVHSAVKLSRPYAVNVICTMEHTITRYMYTKQTTRNKSNRKDAETNKQIQQEVTKLWWGKYALLFLWQ
jgi:hypothetical protein